jgi:hypothetical protein
LARRRLHAHFPLAVLLLAMSLGCGVGSTGAGDLDGGEDLGEGTRVLFIGNSYLYFADIPGIVQALADSARGEKLAVATVAGPDLALVDHWKDGGAVRRIRAGGWKWVVLQQGPSSTEINRDSLRLTTGWFAGEIRNVGAVPALFSAWPSDARRQDFPRAIESYQLAAQDVSGLFLPVAPAWLQAWSRDGTLGLYSDGLHPSAAGAYLAALVIYGRLLRASPVGLPPAVRLRRGAVLSLPPPIATLLQQAAAAALGPPTP